jgi:RNA polymerase sigma-70 factor, ECF subfamily
MARMPESANITQLLQSASKDRRDLDRLLTAIYDDLHRLAQRHMRDERTDHTLQPTALVNEAYLRLIDQRSATWNDRAHFFAVASRVIRRILVDHARADRAAKRGGDRTRIPLVDIDPATEAPDTDVLALDEALEELAQIDPQQAQVVEMRFFGGLTVEEAAAVLMISPRSVDRDWQCARAWLYCRLKEDTRTPGHG